MSNIHFILWKHQPSKDGRCAIRLRISKLRANKYITIPIKASEKQWSAEAERLKKDKRLNPDYESHNALIGEYETRANDIIMDFERSKIDWTLDQFEDAFTSRAKRGRVELYFNSVVDELRKTGHTGNADCYARTQHMLKLFDAKFSKRVFSEINLKYVKEFNIWMQTPRESEGVGGKVIQREGCSGNTRKYYMKALRALLNRAIQDKEASAQSYPFGKGGFEIGKLEEKTDKRYLPSEYMQRIKESKSENYKTETARRMFLFSYYCHGISYVDMAMLTKSNIVKLEGGKYIVYKRQKTMRDKGVDAIKILINDQIAELLKWFKEECEIISPYLVPIVSKADYTGEQLYKHIRYRYNKYSAGLKELAKELEIDDVNLTSYVSRHTMAMTLQRNQVPREVISQVMGHAELKTTNVYLDSFESEVVDQAVSVL
ncbi:MAG: site-specific integrase [Rikenellaceae bacterium]